MNKKILEYEKNNNLIDDIQLKCQHDNIDNYINELIHYYCNNNTYFNCEWILFFNDFIDLFKTIPHDNIMVLYDTYINIYYMKNNTLCHAFINMEYYIG